VGGGLLALGPRPKKNALAGSGAACVLTLLSEREGARVIGEVCARAGAAWIWLPLENGRPPAHRRDREILEALAGARAALAKGGPVLVHCSAGIHRTGMMGCALLRLAGLCADEARAMLGRLRPVCAAGVGEERLAWGDGFVMRTENRG
jgi:protein-tyrosine phosphatase